MTLNRLRGILPAAVTPFDDSKKFNPSALERLLERLYGRGVHGVYLCGSTGEGLLQPIAQRKAVTEVAVKNSAQGQAGDCSRRGFEMGGHRLRRVSGTLSTSERGGAAPVAPGTQSVAGKR